MTKFDYELGQDSCLKNPNVGDAEIRELLFEGKDLRLRIFQPFDGARTEILLRKLLFLFFHTNYAQNVIDSLSIYESWASARLPAEVDAKVLKREFGYDGKYIVAINSIAGGPLVCGSCGLEIFHEPEPESSQKGIDVVR